MRSNKPKTRQRTSPLSFMFVFTFTASVAVTGVFGLYPNNPITQQYRTVLAQNVAPEFLAPVNGFLGILNVPPIPEDQYQLGDGLVLDPGGWLLEQFGMTVPPLYGPDSTVVVFDPAGALLELFGVDVAALPESTAPLDPAASIFQLIGLTLPPESTIENPPDPAGTMLSFLFPDYDPASVSDAPFDPGGVILAWLIPGYQPPPINNTQNLPPDPGGQLLALFVSPQLFNTSNIPLNPGDVILSWLFPPASEVPLPSEQDIVDAAMTSIVATQPNLASLATNTPTPTLTLTPENALTFTPTYTLTPTGTASSVVIYPTLTSTTNPLPANTPTLTLTPTPTPPVVNSLNDPGDGVCDASECTLREAIAAVSPGGTITFASGLSGQTIMPASGELTIAKNLTIDGSMLASRITISANYDSRVFNISSGYTVTLKSLIIADGFANGVRGGGISNDGTLTVMDSLFSGNTTQNQWGGAIANQGTLTVTNSTFSGNTVTNGDGAAIVNGAGTLIVTGSTFSGNTAAAGGAIRNDGTASIANSTFSGNSATPFWGGAIVNFGTMTVTNSTFSGNSSSNSGGGISNRNPGSLTLVNTILTSSTGGDCVTDSALGGASKNNLITNTGASACNLINGTNGNVIGSSPNLGALANNGGSTLTFALLAGSPAIDAGDDSSCPSTDQRGSTRPQGLHCDIGSYESSFTAPIPAGHTISSFSLNGGGNAVTVPGGSSVTIDYTYQVWGDSSTCPGCNYQLVWGLENNWQYCSAWTSPSPGDYPGLTGTGSQFTITAPATSGTYTIYSFSGQYTDCTAAAVAYSSAGGTAIGQIEVIPSVVLYEGGTSDGNIGPRASADAVCAANLPPGYGNYHAFIAYSALDSIANMPANYGVPTNIPIYSASNILIANDWADLTDGTIATTLISAGVASNSFWWSGVDDASGVHTDGVTPDCLDWTSNSNSDPGTVGGSDYIDTRWMYFYSNASCQPVYSILCIGY